MTRATRAKLTENAIDIAEAIVQSYNTDYLADILNEFDISMPYVMIEELHSHIHSAVVEELYRQGA